MTMFEATINVESYDQLKQVYALLAGTSGAGETFPKAPVPAPPPPPVNIASAATPAVGQTTPSPSAAPAAGISAPASTSTTATAIASPSEGSALDTVLDAAGVPWSADKHASTKAKVGSGLWRMKVGVKRLPEESEDSPNYVNPNAAAPAAAAPPPPPPPPVTVAAPVEEDEFAAFATAAAPAAPVARTWTDADLSKLCNQAAVKDGNPDRVRSTIAKYLPEGEVQHSRNIPAAQREAFASELETVVGITYEG